MRTRATIFTHDLVMIPVAWFGGYWLRFNLESVPEPLLTQAITLLPVLLVSQGGMLWYFGLYRGIWRFASIPDLMRIIKAVGAGLTIAAAAIFLATRLTGIPRSVFVLDGLLLVLLLGGPRFIYRWAKDRHLYMRPGQRALIVGAGRTGEMLVRDLLRDQKSANQPIVFVDDNPAKIGKEIHGLRVVGACVDIPEVVREHEIDLILIALPSASGRELRRIVEICESTRLPLRTLPRLHDIVSGRASVNDLREIQIEDLLGREQVQLNWDAITATTRGRTILVTGGGGSIGSELCRQIARLAPERLIIYESSEYNLYTIERELCTAYPGLVLVPLLGDVCDVTAVEEALRVHQPHVVFHAAAYKHVPMLEHQARAAVRNNLLGTRVVASAARQSGCDAFVLISSDKAVHPANIMGATKRAAEIACQEYARGSKTRFITVRFGNVLGSSGSVVPLFREQIARGGPVTVTHPDVIRYFMTIPEACQLILQAGAVGAGGEIFVLDMGEPVRIRYLAEQLIRLSGKVPGEDIEIVYTGLRPGEKLFEELFYNSEQLVATPHPKTLLARGETPQDAELGDTIEALIEACQRADEPELKRLLERFIRTPHADDAQQRQVSATGRA